MPQISFNLSSKVDVSDAENIARYVQVPAMQNGPLYRTMFPLSDTITETQRDEIIRWYADMLEDAFQDRWESFLKARSIDGTPVGFCGWTVIERNREQVEANNGQANEPPKKEKRKKTWIPEVIDIDGWSALSRALRMERDRVLKNLDNICRLTFMAVNPKYQRQGIGSAMMQRICEEIDQHGRYAYVLAAPDGVRLYTKFGFEIVGRVETPQGIITSMLRQQRQS
ncbi:acyl-CoA N-acyltransferase [Durotheca rogersii]|uniref:acyl-CoA N-acyltransferase n=1 Tax=Durotheca rogersii TaxID=419775 RepID=UPI00221F0012|nr:acyl-CoA N-acyltransferase [Durotheca rogersii]KAI5865851.1 acyl-CoA N-acyltransferase [Durotheca rogersii]